MRFFCRISNSLHGNTFTYELIPHPTVECIVENMLWLYAYHPQLVLPKQSMDGLHKSQVDTIATSRPWGQEWQDVSTRVVIGYNNMLDMTICLELVHEEIHGWSFPPKSV